MVGAERAKLPFRAVDVPVELVDQAQAGEHRPAPRLGEVDALQELTPGATEVGPRPDAGSRAG